MAKVSNDTYDEEVSKDTTVNSWDLSLTSWYTQYKRDTFTYTASKTDTYKYKIEFSRYLDTDWLWGQTEIYKNDTKITEIKATPPFINTIDLSSWDILKIKYQALSSGLRFIYDRSAITIYQLVPLYSGNAKWKPRELSNLWQYASITLFWIHTDWSRVDHE